MANSTDTTVADLTLATPSIGYFKFWVMLSKNNRIQF